MALTPGATVPALELEHFPRFMNREGTISISVRKEALVIEASDYPGWETFSEMAARALAARTEVAPVVGVERIGLRYIDEIRVPNGAVTDWSEWVSPSLLNPPLPTEIDMPVSQWQGVAIYGVQPGNALVLRYGPRDGHAVDPSSDLRRTKQADGGHFFLMDIDSFWAPDRTVPKYDADEVASICNKLHQPVRALFESLITDRLRDEVLRGNA
jgi:uncharacterized protein (TIGR04255 family)